MSPFVAKLKPGAGKNTLLRLCLLGLILSLGSACVTTPKASGRVAIPAWPTLSVQPIVSECETSSGRQGQCIEFWKADYDLIHQWIVALVKELEAACLQFGQVTLPAHWERTPEGRQDARKRVEAACYVQ